MTEGDIGGGRGAMVYDRQGNRMSTLTDVYPSSPRGGVSRSVGRIVKSPSFRTSEEFYPPMLA